MPSKQSRGASASESLGSRLVDPRSRRQKRRDARQRRGRSGLTGWAERFWIGRRRGTAPTLAAISRRDRITAATTIDAAEPRVMLSATTLDSQSEGLIGFDYGNLGGTPSVTFQAESANAVTYLGNYDFFSREYAAASEFDVASLGRVEFTDATFEFDVIGAQVPGVIYDIVAYPDYPTWPDQLSDPLAIEVYAYTRDLSESFYRTRDAFVTETLVGTTSVTGYGTYQVQLDTDALNSLRRADKGLGLLVKAPDSRGDAQVRLAHSFTPSNPDGYGEPQLTVQTRATPDFPPIAGTAYLSGVEDEQVQFSVDDLPFAVDGSETATITIGELPPSVSNVYRSGDNFYLYARRDQYGTVQVPYIVNDGTSDAVGTIEVEIAQKFDDPVKATGFGYGGTPLEDQDFTFDFQFLPGDLPGADPDALRLIVDQQPQNGTLTVGETSLLSSHDPIRPIYGADVTYTPDPEFSGTDTFSISVTDGNSTATVSFWQDIAVDVEAVDDPLVIAVEDPTSLVLDEDNVATGRITLSDVDDDTSGYVIRQSGGGPYDGTLDLDPQTGAFTYRPDTNFNGVDQFTVIVSDFDGPNSSEVGRETFFLTINSVNDPPRFANGVTSPGFPEDTQWSTTIDRLVQFGKIVDVDTPTQDLRFVDVGGGVNGQFTMSSDGRTVTYVPNADFAGRDEVTVWISDGQTVISQDWRVTVRPVIDAPELLTDRLSIAENPEVGDVIGQLQATTVEDAGIVFSNPYPENQPSVTIDADGTVRVADPAWFDFENPLGFNGQLRITAFLEYDEIEVGVDGGRTFAFETFEIDVTDANDPATFVDNQNPPPEIVISEGGTKRFAFLVQDQDSGPETLRVSIPPTEAGTFEYVQTFVRNDLGPGYAFLVYDFTAARGVRTPEGEPIVLDVELVDTADGSVSDTRTLPITLSPTPPPQFVGNGGPVQATEDTPGQYGFLVQDLGRNFADLEIEFGGSQVGEVGEFVFRDFFRREDLGPGYAFLVYDYFPAADFNTGTTPASVEFTVVDTVDGSRSQTQTLGFNVTPVNDGPRIAAGQVFTVDENTALGTVVGQIDVVDPEGDEIRFNPFGNSNFVFQLTESGELVVNGELDFEAQQTEWTFPVFARDEFGASGPESLVDITVRLGDVDDAAFFPFEESTFQRNAAEDQPFTFPLLVADQDTPIEDLRVEFGPTEAGTFAFDRVEPWTGSNGINNDALVFYTFTPAADFNTGQSGPLDVTVTAINAVTGQRGETTTFPLAVTPVNDGPRITRGQVLTVDENVAIGTVVGRVEATDPEGDAIEFVPFPNPGLFQLTESGDIVTNRPIDFETADPAGFTFPVWARDEFGASGPDSFVDITVQITDVDDAPVFPVDETDRQRVAAEDRPNTFGFLVLDQDSSFDRTRLEFAPTEAGTFAFDRIEEFTESSRDGDALVFYTFTPTPDFNTGQTGPLEVTVTAFDSASGLRGETTTFPLYIDPRNDAPVGDDLAVSGDEDSPITGTATASDVDGDDLTFSLATGPASGSVTVNDDGSFEYVGDPDFFGSDTFAITVSDGRLDDVILVDVTVDPVNDKPVAEDLALTVDEDGQVTGQIVFSDVDNDLDELRAFYLLQSPIGAMVDVSEDGSFTYAPPAEFSGTDSFLIGVLDNGDTAALAAVTVTVNPVNDAPVGDDLAVSGDEEAAITGTVTASDVDSAELTFTLGTGPASGSVTVGGDGSFEYVGDVDFFGTDSFTVVVSDGELTDELTVTVEVANVNDAPVLDDALFAVDEGSAAGTAVGTVTATDVEGDAVSYAIVGGNEDGQFAIDAATGAITVAAGADIDFETLSSYQLTVRATESSTAEALTDDAVVDILVGDVSEELEIEIDIDPGDRGNTVSLLRNRFLRVALLGGDDFDVTDVDLDSVTFGVDGDETGAEQNRRGRFYGYYRDVDGDGTRDLVLFFDLWDTGLFDDGVQFGQIDFTLNGQLDDGTAFSGSDSINLTLLRTR